MIRLIATDMDGTLLNSRKEVPSDFIPWVISHPDIKVCIASGRQYHTLKDDFSAIADHLILMAENGGLVFENDQILYSNPMSKTDIINALKLASSIPSVTPILCGAKSAYMPHTSPEIQAQGMIYYHRLEFTDDLYQLIDKDIIVKIALYIDNYNAEHIYNSIHMPCSSTAPVLSGISWIDIANSSASKGTAMEAIQKTLCIKPEECMAFGDYLNDYSLLQTVSESYCMANGHDKLKAIAKHIAASNDDDGVMKILRKLN